MSVWTTDFNGGSVSCGTCQFCMFAQPTQAQLWFFHKKEMRIKYQNVQFKENV